MRTPTPCGSFAQITMTGTLGGPVMANLPLEITSPVELEAEIAIRRLGAGRTQPIALRARAVDSSAESVECVVKPRQRLTMAPLEYLCEWVGSAVALAMGLRTPRPRRVRIDRFFADSVMDPTLRQDLHASIGLAFGSEYVSDGFTQYAVGLELSSTQRKAAAMVLGFDVFVHNPDRRAVNPNLFVDRSDFLLFDHEQAFSFLLPLIGGPPPETSPALDIVEHHALRHAFGRSGPDFGPFREAVSNVDDPTLEAIAESVAGEWTIGAAQAKLPRIMEVLARRRDQLDKWLPQVEAAVMR